MNAPSGAKRFSKQRFTVLDELSKVTSHPTAEEVYAMTKAKIPNISLGTVYRNLKNLEAEGTILKFTLDGKEHFDANIKPHVHLCCEKCGRIEDYFCDIAFLDDKVLVNKVFKINNVVINGICQKCLTEV